jgi:flagellar biosynthesis/type III secretory pathway chaperone
VEPRIAELIEIVQDEICTFQRLLDNMEREQRALVTNDVEELDSMVVEQQNLTAEAGRLEAERTKVVTSLSTMLGAEPDSVTLRRLVEQVQGPQSERLGEMRETLIDLQEKIRQTNRHNLLLIKQSMKYVDKTLHILAGGDGSEGLYAQSGKVENATSAIRGTVNQIV